MQLHIVRALNGPRYLVTPSFCPWELSCQYSRSGLIFFSWMTWDHTTRGELWEGAVESLSPLLGSCIQPEALTLCLSVPSAPLPSTAPAISELDLLTLLPSLTSDTHGHGWHSQGCFLDSDTETSALVAQLLWTVSLVGGIAALPLLSPCLPFQCSLPLLSPRVTCSVAPH